MESGFIIITDTKVVDRELFLSVIHPDWGWVDDSRKALRFAREQDAKSFVEVLQTTGVLTMPIKIMEYHWS